LPNNELLHIGGTGLFRNCSPILMTNYQCQDIEGTACYILVNELFWYDLLLIMLKQFHMCSWPMSSCRELFHFVFMFLWYGFNFARVQSNLCTT